MKYLTEQDMNRSWAFGSDVCQMRREVRQLIDRNPEAFATCAREFMEYGTERFPELKTTGGRFATPEHSLAALLAEYRIALENGVTQECFLESEGEKWIRSADMYTTVKWKTESTVRDKLQQARKLAKEDADFQEQVDFYISCFKEIGGSLG
jgi:hypothetical protein